MNASAWAQWTLLVLLVLNLIVMIAGDVSKFHKHRDTKRRAIDIALSFILQGLILWVTWQAGAFSLVFR